MEKQLFLQQQQAKFRSESFERDGSLGNKPKKAVTSKDLVPNEGRNGNDKLAYEN
jgi:hypothetical protein